LHAVAQEVPYNGLLGAARTLPRRRPFLFNMFLCTSLIPLADYQVQRRSGREFSLRRTGLFFIFAIYQGIAQWVVYISIFSRLFPSAIRFANLPLAAKWRDWRGGRDLAGQIAFDLLVYVPFGYFPVFYAFRGLFNDDPASKSLSNYQEHFASDNLASVSVWLPGDIACFAVPAWLRLPTTHAFSFLWHSIVSYMRGGPDVEAH